MIEHVLFPLSGLILYAAIQVHYKYSVGKCSNQRSKQGNQDAPERAHIISAAAPRAEDAFWPLLIGERVKLPTIEISGQTYTNSNPSSGRRDLYYNAILDRFFDQEYVGRKRDSVLRDLLQKYEEGSSSGSHPAQYSVRPTIRNYSPTVKRVRQ